MIHRLPQQVTCYLFFKKKMQTTFKYKKRITGQTRKPDLKGSHTWTLPFTSPGCQATGPCYCVVF